jgi:hypothetical protein
MIGCGLTSSERYLSLNDWLLHKSSEQYLSLNDWPLLIIK